MSQQTPADSERPGHAGNLGPLRMDYTPTEEERRVFRECNQESFWYSSLPISVVSMAVTQLLISRGALSASGRFGSLPKLAFAGFCGYVGGKMSYMKKCIEKFKNLENSPLGEALRQQQRHQHQKFTQDQSELSDPNKADFEPAFQLEDQKDQSFSYDRDFTYSDPVMTSSTQNTASSNNPSHIEEDVQDRRVLYGDLRSKHRENYEVTMTKKSEMLLKPSERSSVTRGKKNIYGDNWEE